MYAEKCVSMAFRVDRNGRLAEGMDDDGDPIQQHYSVEEAGAKLRELAIELADTKDIGYSEALRRVVADPKNAALAQAYSGVRTARPQAMTPRNDAERRGKSAVDIGLKVRNLTMRLAEKDGCSYSEALRRVLDRDPGLKRAYVGS